MTKKEIIKLGTQIIVNGSCLPIIVCIDCPFKNYCVNIGPTDQVHLDGPVGAVKDYLRELL